MSDQPKKNGSQTSAFGSPSRANHDSSKFIAADYMRVCLKQKKTFFLKKTRYPQTDSIRYSVRQQR